jgi:hypothetical protein
MQRLSTFYRSVSSTRPIRFFASILFLLSFQCLQAQPDIRFSHVTEREINTQLKEVEAEVDLIEELISENRNPESDR